MKQTKTKQSIRGFTLLEIIGVIAVIAILAAVLAPRVTSVIGRSKVNGTVGSIASLNTATADYIAANSSLPLRSGAGTSDKPANVTEGRFDADLQEGGHLEKLFACAIGTQPLPDGSSSATKLSTRTHVRVQTAKPDAVVAVPTTTAGGNNFNLDRDAAKADFTTGQMVASTFIPGVAMADAIALNKQLDGVVNTNTAADINGRCIYSVGTSGKVTVYVYLGHY